MPARKDRTPEFKAQATIAMSEPIPLSCDLTVFDIRATALTNEFTWDDWTQVRHAYLCARHQARFHPEGWQVRSNRLPTALADLVEALRTAIDTDSYRKYAMREVMTVPLEDLHTLTRQGVEVRITHVISQPPIWVFDSWQTGVLPLLILRLLDWEIVDRMKWTKPSTFTPLIDERESGYGFDSWTPTGEQVEIVVEGLLEDVAYHVIAHDPNAAATIESLDGSVCFYAASLGLVIGEDPLRSPSQGERVRLRTWVTARARTREIDAGSINEVEEWTAGHLTAAYPGSDILVRLVLTNRGGEAAPLAWHLWKAYELDHQYGWVHELNELDEDEEEPDFEYLYGEYLYTDEAEEEPVIDDDPGPLQFARVEAPDWMFGKERSTALDRVLLGGQAEWNYAFPWMYRLLAGDHPGAQMPTRPYAKRSSPRPHGYWAALYELLTYNLGWSHPTLGLEWWLDNGRPVGDRKLRLLRDVWYADGYLDWFRAWLYTSPPDQLLSHRVVDHPSRRPERPRLWFGDVERHIRQARVRWAPYGGGGDPFHLHRHSQGASAGDTPASHSVHRLDDGSILVVFEGLLGWYNTLRTFGPDDRVQIIVPWIGVIGVFTRSPVTHLWHSTTEEIRRAGNLFHPVDT